MKHKIISTSGRVEVGELEIPPYPKLLHLDKLKIPMYAQKKINGYNVRICKYENSFVCLLRGGLIDERTTELIELNLKKELDRFFRVYPNLVICMEVFGLKTMANYKGDKDFDYSIFDIMNLNRPEKTRFLNSEVVKNICDTFNLKFIGNIGLFDDIKKLKKEMLKLDDIYEGVVLKSVNGNEILKYKWEDDEVFKDKIKKQTKLKFKESKESKIVSHFIQGYSEPKLGLNEGISGSEFKEYQKMLESLSFTDKKGLGVKAVRISDYLMKLIKSKGDFDEKLLKKIEKVFKQNIGKYVQKVIKSEIYKQV